MCSARILFEGVQLGSLENPASKLDAKSCSAFLHPLSDSSGARSTLFADFCPPSMLCRDALVSPAQSARALFAFSRRVPSKPSQPRKTLLTERHCAAKPFASRCTLRRTSYPRFLSSIRATYSTTQKMTAEVCTERFEEITATYKRLARTPFIEQGTLLYPPPSIILC